MRKTIVGFEAAAFATVDQETRTISGLLLPFGQVSRPAKDRATGKVARYTFSEGSVTLPDYDAVPIILNFGHDSAALESQVGIANHMEIKSNGVHAAFKIARTPEGDRVLALAADKILRFFSAEVNGDFGDGADGVRHAKASTIDGAAVVLKPAFEGAQITSVAASAAQEEETPMKCTKCDKVHADGVTACAAPAPTFGAAEAVALQEKVQGIAETLAEMQKIQIPVGPGSPQLQVTEEPIYRFAGHEPAPSGFDFATDLLAAVRGSEEALARVKTFTQVEANKVGSPQFVTSGNVDELNPATYRPDMFLGQAPTPASPLYDTFHKGALSNLTPFFWAKLDRATTNVGIADHTEGVDPTAGNFATAAGATVTPIPVSGKVHITREVADQGGNPRVSGLIKAEFDRSFAMAREAKTAALIAAAWGSITSLTAAIAAGASGVVAGRALEAGLVGLQFIPDGSRFTKLFGQQDLYTALSQAIIPQFAGDTVGTKAYPIVNPQNRDGVQGSKYSFIDVAGYRMEPTWSLGASSAASSNSLAADPHAVHVWNSGLTSLDKLQEKVEGWDIGVFAYWAGVVYDLTGLRKVAYDPTA